MNNVKSRTEYGLNIFLFLFFFMLSVEAIYTKEISWNRFGENLINEQGITAILYGIVFFLVGIYFFVSYFKPIYQSKLNLLKELKWLNVVWFFWLIFIWTPIFDFHFDNIRFFKIGILIITSILSYLYHRRIANLKL